LRKNARTRSKANWFTVDFSFQSGLIFLKCVEQERDNQGDGLHLQAFVDAVCMNPNANG